MKKPCLAEFHPFKQKWYEYHGFESESPNYCSSCNHACKMMIMMLGVVAFQEFNTLYGNQKIKFTREQAHDFLDQAYNKHLKEFLGA